MLIQTTGTSQKYNPKDIYIYATKNNSKGKQSNFPFIIG